MISVFLGYGLDVYKIFTDLFHPNISLL